MQYTGLPTATIYADWTIRTLTMGMILALLSIGSVILHFHLRSELLSRMAAERRLEELASKDPLTGIANRRLFNVVASREWVTGLQNNSPVGLLMIDVDHFKSFNDIYGHIRGDRVLIDIAATVTRVSVRDGGLASRYGGEEFAVLLPRFDAAAVEAVARDLVEAIRSRKFVHGGSPAGLVDGQRRRRRCYSDARNLV